MKITGLSPPSSVNTMRICHELVLSAMLRPIVSVFSLGLFGSAVGLGYGYTTLKILIENLFLP
jgi:hypothetical protein